MLKRFPSIVKRGLQAIGKAISRCTKPTVHGPALSTVADIARSKPQLLAENLLLRQQLIVLNRSVKRPVLATYVIQCESVGLTPGTNTDWIVMSTLIVDLDDGWN